MLRAEYCTENYAAVVFGANVSSAITASSRLTGALPIPEPHKVVLWILEGERRIENDLGVLDILLGNGTIRMS